jgi:glutamyl-tRNA reductase
VNKFLHPPMQALKQAARENDSARLDALCEAWSVSSGVAVSVEADTSQAAPDGVSEPEKNEVTKQAETNAESRR